MAVLLGLRPVLHGAHDSESVECQRPPFLGHQPQGQLLMNHLDQLLLLLSHQQMTLWCPHQKLQIPLYKVHQLRRSKQ